MNKPQSMKFILCLFLLLIVFVSACAPRVEDLPPVSKMEPVADVVLEIRGEILYVTLNNGEIYKTKIEADDITVIRPQIGTGEGGSMVYATVLKDGEEVAYLSQSYVAEFMTRKDVEADLGPLTRVLTESERKTEITILVVVLCVIVLLVVGLVIKKKRKPVST